MGKIVAACLLAGLLAGCAPLVPTSGPPVIGAEKTCRRNDADACTNIVFVTPAHGGVSCSASVEYARINMEHGNGNVMVFWLLDTQAKNAGYFFGRSSVVFADWEFERQWTRVDNLSTPAQIVWRDRNDDAKKYAYAVIVFKENNDGSYEKCATPDPWIHNF